MNWTPDHLLGSSSPLGSPCSLSPATQEHRQSRSQSPSLSVLSRGASGGGCHSPTFTAAPVHLALRLRVDKGKHPACSSQCGQRQASCLQLSVWAKASILPATFSVGKGKHPACSSQSGQRQASCLQFPVASLPSSSTARLSASSHLQAKGLHRLQVCREQAYPYHQPQLKTDKAV